jgi:hypothetical protein
MTTPSEDIFKEKPEDVRKILKDISIGMSAEELMKIEKNINVDKINSADNPWRN